MAVPEWLFGPAGDLRPLPPPDMDVVSTVDRFGGIHNGISGGRTVDTLGYKARFEFDLPYLTPEDYAWLEAVFTRQIPGNLYLINPLKKNLLSREASSARPSGTNTAGVYTVPGTGGVSTWVRVTDGPVAWTQRAARWTGMALNSRLHFDYAGRTPILDGEDITFSVYVRSNEAVTVVGYSQEYMNGQWLGTRNYTSDYELTPGTWTRVQITHTGNVSESEEINFGVEYRGGGTNNRAIQAMGAQAEYNSEPTEPALGGGSHRVAIEAMDTVSTRYPLHSVNLKILEV